MIAFVLFMLIATAAGWEFPKQDIIIWNETASLPRGFYLRIPARQIERGDIVVYQPPDAVRAISDARGYASRPNALFLKRVGAVAGDTYRISANGDHALFAINGAYKGQVQDVDSKGRPLPQLARDVDHVVPDGAFLPLAESPRSFDGRYTGPVPLANIKEVVVPLLAIW
ncbi:putative conjugative transfer signal peptidase TraF [Mitsuokella sp. oral taxon 131 str. W9106]|nr:putative conjugative transfer signal peptidase TraF [Mitsuokella sp. oral taxon 131 str. W9106]